MTTTPPPPPLEPSRPAHEREGRLLAELLRTSRLSLLFAESGADKTALLNAALMPLLGRRRGDRTTTPPSALRESSVVPIQDRRSRSSGRTSRRRREVVVFFDAWTDTPLAALRSSVYEAAGAPPASRAGTLVRLSEVLKSLSEQLDVGFIILLDRFEEFLRAPSYRVDIAQFANELIEAVNEDQLPANFLISLSEEARSGLSSFRARIPGFDDFSLKLGAPPGARPDARAARNPDPAAPAGIAEPPVLADVLSDAVSGSPSIRPAIGTTATPAVGAPRTPRVKRPPPPRVQITIDDVYALIETNLSRIATGGAGQPSLADEAVDPSRMGDSPVSTPESTSPVTPASGAGEEAAPAGADPADAARSSPDPADSPTPARRRNLQEAVDWVGRRLRPKSGSG